MADEVWRAIDDEAVARRLDGKQYGTIRTEEAGFAAVERMCLDLRHLGLGRIADRLWPSSLRALEFGVAELDHDGYPAIAREFADVVKQIRTRREYGLRGLPWGLPVIGFSEEEDV